MKKIILFPLVMLIMAAFVQSAVTNIFCDIGTGQVCEGTEEQLFTQVRASCTDTTLADFIILNDTNNFVFASTQNVTETTLFVFDNPDIVLQLDDVMRVNVTCFNSTNSFTSSSVFTVLPAPVDVGAGIITVATAGLSFLVLLIIVLSIVGLTNSKGRGKK